MNTPVVSSMNVEARSSDRVRTLRDFVALAKPRISVMVLLTVAVASLISMPQVFTTNAAINLLHGMFGLLLISASGCALNQYLERYVDWAMPRTAKRPLPDSRLTSRQVACFGAITFGAGLAWLLALVNWQTAAMAGGSWALYVWVYTPMKLRTWLNTYVGAVAGAMPVLVGGTAVCGGQITTPVWLLFAVLYIWQFPHFMAIAWLYRKDYEQGNVKMATTIDPSGRLAGWHAVLFAIALLPVTVWALWPGSMIEGVMLAIVVGLGWWYLSASISFQKDVNDSTARKLFRVSLLHLPLYLVALSIAASV